MVMDDFPDGGGLQTPDFQPELLGGRKRHLAPAAYREVRLWGENPSWGHVAKPFCAERYCCVQPRQE